MIAVLSEASFHDRASINARELHTITEAARLFGCRVFPIPPNFDLCETAENALAYVPTFEPLIPGVWVGYIPTLDRYTAIYQAALTKGIRLLNTPAQYQIAMEFDHFYPRLGDLTPESIVLCSVAECAAVAARLGFPVFVKGAIKSNKEQGWHACVASSEAELVTLTEGLLTREGRSRGRVIARRLVRLRHIQTDYGGFPLGREYRVFLYQQQVLGYGFYWDEYADSAKLAPNEERAMLSVAREAARRVEVPFVAVDMGQLETGEWIVIETGDAQFSGLSQVPVLELWSKIKDIAFAAS